MNRVKIDAGQYRAVSDVVLSQFNGEQHREYQAIAAGQCFGVPRAVEANGFGYFLTYSPDFGDLEPQVERIGD